MRRILLPLLLMAIPAFGQAAYYQNNAFTANYVSGAHVVTVLDGSTVEICTSVTGACSKVAIYADQALTVPLANPMPIDAGGNFGFWVAPGSYSYWILDVNGSALAQTPFTTGGGSGSGSGITALTGDVTASGPGSAAATLATVNSAPGACGDATHVCAVTTNGKGLVTAQSAVAISAGTSGVSSLNALTGALNITAGSNITVTPSGSNIQIAASVPAALSGQTANYLPKANTATTSIGPSIISDDGTTATVHGPLVASNLTSSALGAGNCVQTAAGGLLGTTGAPCGTLPGATLTAGAPVVSVGQVGIGDGTAGGAGMTSGVWAINVGGVAEYLPYSSSSVGASYIGAARTFGTAIASAATIAPLTMVFHVTGTAAISTITPPAWCSTSGYSCTLRLIPDAAFTTTTGGNIALASTAVVGKVLEMTYDNTGTGTWYPSY